MRPKTIRIIESIHSKGVFGPCSCAGEVLYYTDGGVRCNTCGKLYGVWLPGTRKLSSERGFPDGIDGQPYKAGPDNQLTSSVDEYVAAMQTEEDEIYQVKIDIDTE